MTIKENYPLSTLNSFGVPVKTRYFVEINTVQEAMEIWQLFAQKNIGRLVLGGGSNLLFTKDYNGYIIKSNISGIYVVKEDENYFWVKAGSGVQWHALVESCIKANFGGLENLSLIPGTVGAAPIQNIGAYGVEIKDYIEAVEAINLLNGDKKYFKNHECNFGYRDSIFKNELKDQYLITNVVFRLTKKHQLHLDYGKIRDVLQQKNKKKVTISDVSQAVIDIRMSKLPDPAVQGNAGSFFKNPVIHQNEYQKLKSLYSDIPAYPLSDEEIKIPAAWLIDQCGLKGLKHKHAAIHKNQPLVLINDDGKASGGEIAELAKIVQDNVQQKFGIHLHPEVRII